MLVSHLPMMTYYPCSADSPLYKAKYFLNPLKYSMRMIVNQGHFVLNCTTLKSWKSFFLHHDEAERTSAGSLIQWWLAEAQHQEPNFASSIKRVISIGFLQNQWDKFSTSFQGRYSEATLSFFFEYWWSLGDLLTQGICWVPKHRSQ